MGDPLQLPATTFCPNAAKRGYQRSLLERLMLLQHPTIMLDTQYRMSPAIAAFPAQQFYQNKLCNGLNVQQKCYNPAYVTCDPFLSDATTPNGQLVTVPSVRISPVMFLDITAVDRKAAMSRVNADEVAICVQMVQILLQQAWQRADGQIGSIGIITFYLEQLQVCYVCMEYNAMSLRRNLFVQP